MIHKASPDCVLAVSSCQATVREGTLARVIDVLTELLN